MARRRATAARVVTVILLAAAPAAADLTKDQCVSANASAQDLRRAGKLSAAREQLRQCSDPSCPAMVRDDCTQRFDEIERVQPTIIFDVKDGAGRDLVDVTATVDGQPLARALDGSALHMDPGAHVFVFTEPGQAPVTQTFLLRESEKERKERIVIGAPPAAAPAPAGATPTAPTAPPAAAIEARPGGGMSSQKVASLVIGGVGVAGIAAGAVFGLLTISAANQQKTDCATAATCPNYSQAASAHSGGETDGTLSNVTFIAGGALLAAAAILFLTGPSAADPSSPAVGLVVAPGIAPGGGGLWVRGGF